MLTTWFEAKTLDIKIGSLIYSYNGFKSDFDETEPGHRGYSPQDHRLMPQLCPILNLTANGISQK